MYCSKCGAEIPNGANFCNSCGEAVGVSLAKEPEQTVQPTVNNYAMTPIKGVGNSAIYRSFGKGYKIKSSVYVFYTPFDVQRTLTLINDAFNKIGFVTKMSVGSGYLSGVVMMSIVWFPKYEFYVTPSGDGCRVRVIQNVKVNQTPKRCDKIYDEFLQEMFKLEPSVNFGIVMAKGAPYVVAVGELGSNTAVQTNTVSKQNANVLGMAVGNFLFGTAGAIVGGLSGKTKSTGVTREVFAKNRLVSVVFSNGRIFEGEIKKDTPLYNEIMAKI